MNTNKKYWKDRYTQMGGEKTVGNRAWDNNRYRQAIKQLSNEVGPILETIDGEKVLDFGCGIGRWSGLLQMFFDNYYAVDICEIALDQAMAHQNSLMPADGGTHYEIIENGKIPFPRIKFNCIWTCVCLQHIVDPKLIEYTISQFYDRLTAGGTVLITENVSNHRSNHYLAFRSVNAYIQLFEDAGFEHVNTLPTAAMGNEAHATMLFRKPAKTSKKKR